MPAKTPEMTANFGRWYVDAFMADGATREARWNGVAEVAANVDWQMAEVLVRLAFASKVPASGTKHEDLGEVYHTTLAMIAGGGVALDAVRSARELQVLAAAALAESFSRSPDAAIAVCTASFSSVRKPELPMDLVGMAERALSELSHQRHERVDPKAIESTAPKVSFTLSAEASASMDAATWKTELERLRDAATSAISTVVAAQNRAASMLHRQMILGDEELQMLWWLIGGYSRLVASTFKDIDPDARPLILSYELGTMTKVSPGPASIKAILSQAGVPADEMLVQDAVNAVDLSWAQARTGSKNISPVTTPLHFALDKRAELGSAEGWQAGWAGLTDLAADLKLPALQLSELFYREHLFLRVGD